MNQKIIETLKKIFTGDYHLTRTVDTPLLTMEGTTTFQKISDKEIEYKETGTYLLNHKIHDFYQHRYITFDHNFFYILKSDRAVLHQFPLEEFQNPSWKVFHSHPCREDLYTITFFMEGENIIMEYEISGPFKECTVKSIFTPLKKMSFHDS